MTWPMYVPMLKKVVTEQRDRATAGGGRGGGSGGDGGGGGRGGAGGGGDRGAANAANAAAAMFRESDPHLDPHGLDYDEDTGLDLDQLVSSRPLPPPAMPSRSVTAPASIGSPTHRPGSDGSGSGSGALLAAPPLERADSSQPRTIPDGKGGYTREAPYDAFTR